MSKARNGATAAMIVAVLAVAGISVSACAGQSRTAAGGCWYVDNYPKVLRHALGGVSVAIPASIRAALARWPPNAIAVHLPLCHGIEADAARSTFVGAFHMIPGREPSNAKEICQVKVIAHPAAARTGIWADSHIKVALRTAQNLCQELAKGIPYMAKGN